MKQVLLVLVLLVAALGGFLAVRNLPGSGQPTTVVPNRGTGTPQGPNVALPTGSGLNARGGQARPRNTRGGRPDRVRTVEWKSMASPASVVHWDERWSLDQVEYDLEAPIVARVGSLEITQEDLRRMVCLEVLSSYNLAVFSEAVARTQSLARGNQYELTPDLYEEILERQAEASGVTVGERRSALAMQTVTPPEIAEKTHRLMLSALIYNVVGGNVDELPALILQSMRRSNPVGPDGEPVNPQNPALGAFGTLNTLREVWNRVNSSEDYDERASDLDKLSGLVSLQSAFQQGARNRDLGVLAWTFLDREAMEDDVYMRISLAPIRPDEMQIAPWLHGDETVELRVSDVWPAIGPYLDSVKVAEVLESLIWYRVVRASLEAEGALDSDEEAFAIAAQEHLDRSDSLNNAIFVSQSQGYPTLHHYRVAERYMRCHRKMLPNGWDAPEFQRAFFEDNRFFVERWNPQLEFAYFPAFDFDGDSEGDSDGWSIDWDRALEEAKSVKGRVVSLQQDFRELAKAQADRLTRNVGTSFGEEFRDDFAERLRGGVLSSTLREVENRLGETQYKELVHGTTCVKFIAAYGEVGEVVGPLKISGGYALARLASAQLDTLERDWEDAKELCEYYFLRSRFLKWTNERLQSASGA